MPYMARVLVVQGVAFLVHLFLALLKVRPVRLCVHSPV